MKDHGQHDHDQAMLIGQYIATVRRLTTALKLVRECFETNGGLKYNWPPSLRREVDCTIEDGENMS
jgi:hypothetical protein